MGKINSISVGKHFEQFIQNAIKSGRYSSANEVIRSALRLLETEEEKLTALRNALIKGERSGWVEDFDPKVNLSKIHKTKAKFAKAYTPWTEADDEELTLLYCNGKSTTEISAQMERNRGAINSRIRKLELEEKYGTRN